MGHAASFSTPVVADQERDWALVDGPEVAAELGTDPEHGLSVAEAAARLEQHGPNELDAEPPEPAWKRLARQFSDPLIHLLLAAIVISVAAWWFEGAHGFPVDAVVILLIVVANAIIGYVQEGRAADAVAALQRMSEVTAGVVRDGQQLRVPATEVVPGDLLVLAEGDSVPADARLLRASSLQVAEASLTGESQPVTKSPATLAEHVPLGDRTNMVFKGTAVTQGLGRAVVTDTGMGTEMGHIARMLNETEQEATPLEREIAGVGKVLGLSVIVIALVVMGAVALTSDIRTAQDAVDVLLLGVSLAVAAVPEGLPAILSLVLSIGVQAMSRRNAIIKSLSSVETLGSASVICSDKTGTLTRNEMTMVRVRSRSGAAEISGVGYAPEGDVLVEGAPLLEQDPELDLREEDIVVLSGGTLASDAEVRQEEDGSWSVIGDPTEAAFVVAEQKAGLTQRRQERFTRIGEVPFTSDRKMMSVVVEDADHTDAEGRVQRTLVAKGAPDVLLEHCTRAREGERVVELTAADREQVERDVAEMSDQALRTLAVAYRPLEPGEYEAALAGDGSLDGEAGLALEEGLILVGTVGIIDPPRTEAAEAVSEAHRAGIRVVMITGDHPATALRIAQELGIVGQGARAVAGPELDGMDDAQLREVVREVSVFARVAPEHKLQLIAALQAEGQIVSMTGDGVNDAPALRKADIGVAMGVTGTEVSKQAADMILVDDNFSTIVSAVRQGRVIFANIRKFLRYLLSSNMGEVLTMFLGVMLAGYLGLTGHGEAVVAPLLATQILWINLVTDSAPALAMGIDPETEDVMAARPRPLSERVINTRMWTGILTIGLVMAVVTLLALDMELPGGLVEGHQSVENARTAAFTTLVLAQLFNALNSRSETVSAFHRLFTNRWLWLSLAFGLVSQVAVVHVPFLQAAFGTEALTLDQWLKCLALASCVLWFDELRKVVLRWRGEPAPAEPTPRLEPALT
ncbi:plasma-membrane calcium-translocating P-type ATPase/potassium and/or sodium efflux P-type ATPase,TIGR01523 [Kytococcus aerolatus]|uniref:Plasma-membrane calcium-translocating P-type ATPase/potassium and/or sodium efflux P-type ATPase,TIGR01523 n=1 Tax=Kytococcus aerolatus TaxID=592308 RepID=A0A212T889_9MICO|nr:cation-translocating P-type ATPase [Kytococcus aerolatus]SNC62277.1 plasma-membrane calcium-translocating P-type ATPase/potassium and/or sodium efflux P-type ATPase,TIGR01523 [Kytococcus aerolatus]